MLSFIGIAIGLLGSTWSQMVSATVEEVTNDTNAIMKLSNTKTTLPKYPSIKRKR
jgi:hypothetical protein